MKLSERWNNKWFKKNSKSLDQEHGSPTNQLWFLSRFHSDPTVNDIKLPPVWTSLIFSACFSARRAAKLLKFLTCAASNLFSRRAAALLFLLKCHQLLRWTRLEKLYLKTKDVNWQPCASAACFQLRGILLLQHTVIFLCGVVATVWEKPLRVSTRQRRCALSNIRKVLLLFGVDEL